MRVLKYLFSFIFFFVLCTQTAFAITPVSRVDIATGSDESWSDVDVTAHVGGDAGDVAGVLVEIRGYDTDTDTYGVRNNGSTDTETVFHTSGSSHTFFWVGVDSNDIFEVYLQDVSAMNLYLLAYVTNDEAGFFTNRVDVSLGSTGSWTDVDISSDTGADTALVAFLQVQCAGATAAARENGSTDNRLNSGRDHSQMISVDENEIMELYISNTACDQYVMGYLTDNVTTFTNMKDYTTGTTGSYEDVDLSSDVPAGSVGAFFQMFMTGYINWNVRENGSSDDVYTDTSGGQAYAWTEIDGSAVAEQKIETTSADLYLMGYSELSGDAISTAAASGITATAAQLNGTAVYVDESAMDLFFEYGESMGGPYTATTTIVYDTGGGAFNDTISSLDYNTTYYFRAGGYGTTTSPTYYYGDELNFTTLDLDPVTTATSTAQGSTTATVNGELVDLGKETSIEVGFIYGIDGSYTATATAYTATTSLGTYSADLTGLTTYEGYTFKAYASTSPSLLWYGSEYQFFTGDISTSTPITGSESHHWDLSSFNDGTHSTTTIEGTALILEDVGGGTSLEDAESFENTFGDWNNDTGSGSNCWQFDTNTTGSSNTGPSGPEDGTYYVYTETSSSACNSSNWDSITYTLAETGGGYVEFYYHMYGVNMGTLTLEQYDGSTWEAIWTKSGQQEQTDELDPWTDVDGVNDAVFDDDTQQIRFYYTGATSFRGDAGLDLVQVYTGGTGYEDGVWISAPWSVGSIDDVDDSFIEFSSTTPSDTTVTVKTAVNSDAGTPPDPGDYTTVSSGGEIAGISENDDLTGKYVWVRIELGASTDAADTPTVTELTMAVNQGAGGGAPAARRIISQLFTP